MVQLRGPTTDDVGLAGDIFADAMWRALNRTLEETASGLHGFVTLEDLAAIQKHWGAEVDGLLDHVADAHALGAGITRINQHGAIVKVLRERSLTAAAGDVTDAVENPFQVPLVENARANELLTNARNRLVAVGDDVWSEARSQLVKGTQAGEGIAALKQRVINSANFSGARAEMVARSEVAHAMNQGAIEQMSQLGVNASKEWIAIDDDRTRPAHLEADGEKVPLDGGVFSTGDDPGDEPNCRCTLGFDVPDDDVAAYDDSGQAMSSEDSFVQSACGCANALLAALTASVAFAKYDPEYAAAYRAKKKAERAAAQGKESAPEYVPPKVDAAATAYVADVAHEAETLPASCTCTAPLPTTTTVIKRLSDLPDPGANARYDIIPGKRISRAALDRANFTNRDLQARVLHMNDVIMNRFGGYFSEVEDTIRVDGGDNMAAYVRNGNILGLNPAKLTDSVIKEQQEHGWFMSGTGKVEDMLVHEYGHFLFGKRSIGVFGSARRDAAMMKAEVAAREAGMPAGYLGQSVSRYAATSEKEAKAELWAKYHMGGSTRSPWVVKWGETLLHELGLDTTPLCEDIGACP